MTTNWKLGLSVLALGLVCTTAQPPQQPGNPQSKQDPQGRGAQKKASLFVIEAGEMTLKELIERASKNLERTILYSEAECQAQGGELRFKIQKRMSLDSEGFEELVSALVYQKQFVMTPLDAKRGVYELINFNSQKRREIQTRAVRMSPAEVLRRSGLYMQTYTTIRTEHIDAARLVNTLRPFFGGMGAGGLSLQIQNAGDSRSIMLIGFIPQVAIALQMVKDTDVSHKEVTKLEQQVKHLERRVQKLEARRK